MDNTNQSSRHTVYHPPEAEEIEAAAALLRKKMDRDTDFEDGFSGLLKAIAKAYANNLSRENSPEVLDNDQKTA